MYMNNNNYNIIRSSFLRAPKDNIRFQRNGIVVKNVLLVHILNMNKEISSAFPNYYTAT